NVCIIPPDTGCINIRDPRSSGMKKLLIPLLFVLPLSAVAGDGRHPDQGDLMAKHMERVAEDRELDEAQRKEIRSIFEDHRSKTKALREDTEARVNGVLTPEQRKKKDALQEKRREKWEERKDKWIEKRKENKSE